MTSPPTVYKHISTSDDIFAKVEIIVIMLIKEPVESHFSPTSIASSSSSIAFLAINSVLEPIQSTSSPLSLPMMRPAVGLGSSAFHATAQQVRRRPRAVATCSAFRPDRDNYGGALVDEGMAVLRRRIREARMAETNYEAPPGWAAWEKRYYPAYVSDVSILAGALQLMLMGTRPTVAVAVATLLLGGVPVSAAVALHLLRQAAGTVLQHVS
uniref:Uncharacterized protein n=1 Tax=Avena sativa TaxID=4498 RepID=A0ACD5TS99_AVESA